MPHELINVTDVGMLVNAVGIVAGVLAIKVVREIDHRQQGFGVRPVQHLGASAQRGAHAPTGPRTY